MGWHSASALLDDMMTMGVSCNIHRNWGSARMYMSDMGPCSGLSCCRSWNGVYCSKPTGPSSSLPLDHVQHSKAPPFSTALLLIGHLCRHGDNSCLWDEEATFGVPASLTACNWRIPKPLVAFKTHAHRRVLGLYKEQCPLEAWQIPAPRTTADNTKPGRQQSLLSTLSIGVVRIVFKYYINICVLINTIIFSLVILSVWHYGFIPA